METTQLKNGDWVSVAGKAGVGTVQGFLNTSSGTLFVEVYWVDGAKRGTSSHVRAKELITAEKPRWDFCED